MKRDLELIKNILNVIENEYDEQGYLMLETFTKKIPQATKATIHGHLRLLIDENFIYGKSHLFDWLIVGLSWKGHNFLNNAKNEIIWKKAMFCAGNLSFDIFNNILNEIATKQAESMLNNLQ
jgi:hypothetical protein